MSKSKQKNKSQEKISDFIENPEAIVDSANEIVQNKKNQRLFIIIFGILALIVGGLYFYNDYIESLDKEAQEELVQAQFYFEIDSLNLALNGDGNNYGFIDIIEKYSGSKSANLANYYAGVCFLKIKDFENAVRYLKDFNSLDGVVQARAYSLIGDAYLETDDFDNAIDYYQKATEYKPNEWYTPMYLKKLALAYENNNDLERALGTYQIVIDDFSTSTLIHDARKQKARLEAAN